MSIITAVGDIHGCLSALTELMKHIEDKYNLSEIQMIFLGDYIDRGESSRGVLDFLIEFQKNHKNSEFVLGNHEYMLINDEPYGIKSGESVLTEYVDGKITIAHLSFLKDLKPYIESNSFVFTHGGIPYGFSNVSDVPVDGLVWEYGVWKGYSGKPVVCGHSARSEVRQSNNSICIDTGCYNPLYGKLTAAVLNDNSGELIETISVQNKIYGGRA